MTELSSTAGVVPLGAVTGCLSSGAAVAAGGEDQAPVDGESGGVLPDGALPIPGERDVGANVGTFGGAECA